MVIDGFNNLTEMSTTVAHIGINPRLELEDINWDHLLEFFN